MRNPVIRFPVVCPFCGDETLTEFPVAQLAEALLANKPIALRAGCSDAPWNASERERCQIREYLAVVPPVDPRLPSHRSDSVTEYPEQ